MTDCEPHSRNDLPVGYRVGEWALTHPLGSGSWGVVYAARSTTDDRPAAVKLLRTDLLPPGQRESMAELIHREVRFSLEADHPHIVRTHEALTLHDGERPKLDGVIALVMDQAERNLGELLDTDPGTPVADAARILRGAGDGLAHLHDRGWVHGDIKPANVLLAADGGVWLADFGLTAELDGTHAYVPPLGSLDHVPPEWWSQRAGGRSVVRPTADLWAYGVVAHQVLTGGRHPFPGSTARARSLAAQAYARGTAELRLDNAVPAGWRLLIAECLRPDHASRSELSARDLAERVHALCDSASFADSAASPQSPGRRSRRRTRLLAATCVVLFATGGGTALLLNRDSGAGPEAPAPGARPSEAGASAGTGALPASSDIPESLRPTIVRAANRCPDKEVTPVLIAAMLKAESNFDADAARPEDDEYGIAMWTPSVFNAWGVDGDHDGRKDHMNPKDAVPSMAVYLCWLDQQFKKKGLDENLPELIVAGYRTSSTTVIKARGVPSQTEAHVNKVSRYLEDYAR